MVDGVLEWAGDGSEIVHVGWRKLTSGFELGGKVRLHCSGRGYSDRAPLVPASLWGQSEDLMGDLRRLEPCGNQNRNEGKGDYTEARGPVQLGVRTGTVKGGGRTTATTTTTTSI